MHPFFSELLWTGAQRIGKSFSRPTCLHPFQPRFAALCSSFPGGALLSRVTKEDQTKLPKSQRIGDSKIPHFACAVLPCLKRSILTTVKYPCGNFLLNSCGYPSYYTAIAQHVSPSLWTACW